MKKNTRKKSDIPHSKIITKNQKKKSAPYDNNTKKIPKKKSFFHKAFTLFILIVLTFILLAISFLAIKSYIFKSLASEMFNSLPSTVYDTNKNVIAQLGSQRNREYISFNEIPSNIINAYIAIEDQRYYSHYGVDIKRTGAAILSYITHKGSSSFGGSTITQQLVKNLTGDDSNSAFRKVKEWFYAWTLNFSFSKDEIIQAYLNIIYTGPNIYGVKKASTYYFNKDISDLSLAQCAFLAGINNAPNSYNPFSENDKTEKITKRTKTVLNKMLEQNYITKDEYNSAIEELSNGLKFEKGNLSPDTTVYSYHTDALINELISDLSEKKGISRDFAENFLYLSGCNIYSTQNPEIQTILEKEVKDTKYLLKSSNNDSIAQTALVVIDHSTGCVTACIRRNGRKKQFTLFK